MGKLPTHGGRRQPCANSASQDRNHQKNRRGMRIVRSQTADDVMPRLWTPALDRWNCSVATSAGEAVACGAVRELPDELQSCSERAETERETEGERGASPLIEQQRCGIHGHPPLHLWHRRGYPPAQALDGRSRG